METGRRVADEPSSDHPIPAGASIRVLMGFYEGLEVPVDRDWLVIGRGRGADLMLAEPTVSRAHAAIGFDGRAFYVQDLGSTNGTWCNGVSCERERLSDGDEIQIGGLRLGVRLPAAAGVGGERGAG